MTLSSWMPALRAQPGERSRSDSGSGRRWDDQHRAGAEERSAVILEYLDAGAGGIIVPNITTRDETEAMVAAMSIRPSESGVGSALTGQQLWDHADAGRILHQDER